MGINPYIKYLELQRMTGSISDKDTAALVVYGFLSDLLKDNDENIKNDIVSVIRCISKKSCLLSDIMKECYSNRTESVYANITIITEEGGSAEGTGSYAIGSNIMLRAYPKAGYVFDGWYIDNELVTKESLFQLNVTRTETYKAKFSLMFDVYVGFYNGDKDVLDIDAFDIKEIELNGLNVYDNTVYTSPENKKAYIICFKDKKPTKYTTNISTEISLDENKTIYINDIPYSFVAIDVEYMSNTIMSITFI